MTKLPISIYIAYFQMYGQIIILCWLFADKNIHKQPYCQQLPDNAFDVFIEKNTQTCVIALTES